MRQRSPFSGTLSDVDVSLLREFLEIAAAGGITAAEPRLNKSKSAISIGLTKLEQRLGVRLCERGRSGFALTEQGRLIHTATEQLMSEINRFSDFVGSASHRLEGEVSVMIDDSFIFEMEQPIASTIAKMNEHYPQLDLKIRMTAPDRVLESVLEGNADLGFTGLIRSSDALNLMPMFEEEMGLFCGADHPLFNMPEAELSYEILQRYSFVRTGVTQTEEFRNFLSGLSFQASAPTILSRILLILSSRYLGFVPLAFAAFWEGKGSIRELRVPGSRVKIGCYLVHRKSRPLGMAAGTFKDTLSDEVKKHVASLPK
ncbi:MULTISPECIES: LysR family transcriptional regulator [Roseobacteraceae]|jgi:DNA-binding transcriptional LysR family regulator|uniref:LysR family transcriptional regulator n=1 Tax=Roseobacteraceae TaxID=2854170 RepID=UPI0007C3BED1|nr:MULTISPECIES: LysR family transcriptional regulator [unclassified Sulfitobacter]MEC9312909.1 LysR family transcriptional regulator [Pseudomonadota bacterium]KZX93829.1 hypothetical protein A3721_11240 [Sulfitobacter sp. HI0023]KZY24627.1 hypothetical protein A3728_20835 [Sulfitobacter sp. HI0040]KZY49706.1 hypothetical protein A3734_09695 [Sulfitobacter sp. HI0054]KZZ68827.1 hypothetical protein A3764_12260 [Sulfitobacter sp. HI0129]